MGNEKTARQAATQSCSGQPFPLPCIFLYVLWYRSSRCKASSLREGAAVGHNHTLHLQLQALGPTERGALESRCYSHQQAPLIAQRSSSSSSSTNVRCTERLASHAIAGPSTVISGIECSRELDRQQPCKSASSLDGHARRLEPVMPVSQQKLRIALYQYASLAQQQPDPIVRGRK